MKVNYIFQNIRSLKIDNINSKDKILSIKQIKEQSLKVASAALASIGVATIAMNQKKDKIIDLNSSNKEHLSKNSFKNTKIYQNNKYKSKITTKEEKTNTISPKEKLEIKNKIIKLFEKYNTSIKTLIDDFWEHFDYENANRHLNHLETLLKYESKRLSFIINKGYFSSKEGADAMDWVLNNFKVNPHHSGIISEVDLITQELNPEQILKAKTRKTTNVNRFIDIAQLTEDEYTRWLTSPYQNEMYYISTNNEINKILSKLNTKITKFLRDFDKIILDDIAKNPQKESEILEFYKTFFNDNNNDIFKIQTFLETKEQISAYKKAYQYLKENNLTNYKIVIVDSDRQNLYNEANIENFHNHKQILKEWNIAFFDQNGNLIRRDNADTSDTYNTESITTQTGHIDYDADIIKNKEGRTYLKNSSKKVFDNNGNLLYTEKYQTSSSVKNKYDIIREYPNGKIYKIGLAEISPTGNIYIEKTLVTETGIKTDYNYLESPDGTRLNYTRIRDAKNNVIFENRYQYKVINDRHFITIENGVKYDIQYRSNFKGSEEVFVTRSDGETVSILIGDNSESSNAVLSKDLLPLLKQMPGSFYFDINKFGLKKIGLEINSVRYDNAHYNFDKNLIAISTEWKDAIFTLAHEFGHYRDWFSKISSDPDVIDTFMKERKALIENQSQFEARQINYFINAKDGRINNNNDSIKEIVAEINAFIYASNTNPNLELRGQYLQQYFPKTFAKVANKLVRLQIS